MMLGHVAGKGFAMMRLDCSELFDASDTAAAAAVAAAAAAAAAAEAGLRARFKIGITRIHSSQFSGSNWPKAFEKRLKPCRTPNRTSVQLRENFKHAC
jgi:hypothetical protein